MSSITFIWNEAKSRKNAKKYGVTFEEAKTVFADEYARLISDPDHSIEEDRFLLLGLSHSVKLLMVCHCNREEGEVIRIVSARKADKQESRQYKGFRDA